MGIDDMLSRKDVIKRDCPACRGQGWTGTQGTDEKMCEQCGGNGMEEKEIPHDFARTAPLTKAEEAAIWGDPAPDLSQKGPPAE